MVDAAKNDRRGKIAAKGNEVVFIPSNREASIFTVRVQKR